MRHLAIIGPCLSATSRRHGLSRNLDSCFVAKDANGQALAYMYFEKEPRRRFRRELLTRVMRRSALRPSSLSCPGLAYIYRCHA